MNRIPARALVWALACIVSPLSCTGDSATGPEDTGPDDPPPTPQWQTVFADDFNRADGPLGSNYSVVLYDYVNRTIAYNLSVSGNQVPLAGPVMYAVRYDAGVSGDTIRVSASFSFPAATSGGATFGVTARAAYNADNTINGGYSGGVGATDTIGIYRFPEGGTQAATPLITRTHDVQPGRQYRVTLTVSGRTLTLVLTDVAAGTSETLSYTDAASLPSGVGVSLNGYLGSGDTLVFDDFLVEALR